jgi:hypothetical protein
LCENFTRRKLKRWVERIDEKIERYLQGLDENDEHEPNIYKPTAEELREKIAALKQHREEHEALQQQLEESGERQISLTDPDARSMPVGKGRGTEVAYNVQVSVDAQHKLIVDHEVTNKATDRGHLSPMALPAKEILQVETLEVVADRGYYDGQHIKAYLEEVCYVSHNISSSQVGVSFLHCRDTGWLRSHNDAAAYPYAKAGRTDCQSCFGKLCQAGRHAGHSEARRWRRIWRVRI